MAVSDEEIAFARDLFSDLGDITTRKMMGACACTIGARSLRSSMAISD
jgi:hypothetical protein